MRDVGFFITKTLDHQRIEIKLISTTKNVNNSNEYLVKGKSKIKHTIFDFEGSIILKKVKEVKQIEFGVDDEYANNDIKAQGVLKADYEFKENTQGKSRF